MADNRDLGYEQALKYAEELGELYRQEQARTRELEATARALEDLGTRNRLILESVPDGIFGLDLDRRITFVNPAGARMVGRTPEEMVGLPSHELLHHSRADGSPYPQEACPIHLAIDEGRVIRRDDDVFWKSDGTSFPVEYASNPLTQEGRITGAVVTFSDITERRRAEARIQETLEALRRTDEDRRRLLTHLVNAQEEDRRRIAADIHDDSIQAMSAVLMRLHPLQAGASPDQAERIEAIEQAVAESIVRLRNLMFELRPAALDREGLATALRLHFERYRQDLPIDLDVDDRLRAEPPPETRALLYRVALEALANVRKHSKARNANVLLEERDAGFFLRVRDDGIGLTPADAQGSVDGHLGMVSMRERAELAGGWFRVAGSPGEGTTVEFWVPAVGASESR